MIIFLPPIFLPLLFWLRLQHPGPLGVQGPEDEHLVIGRLLANFKP
jgi:hypothetical protein